MATANPFDLRYNDTIRAHEAQQGREWQVGQIEKRSSLYGPEDRWIWALNGVPGASLKEIRLAGVTGTLNEAEVELKKSWEQWLMWANLSEGKA
jgi:hypothetical protein